MQRGPRSIFAVVTVLALTGCASSGNFPSVHRTSVELTEANFQIVATGVEGEASAGYVFGFSSGFGPGMQTLAIARVSGEATLDAAALSDLWQSFEEEYGAVGDRPLALVNVRYDTDALNLLLYTQPTVSVRADVIEFVP